MFKPEEAKELMRALPYLTRKTGNEIVWAVERLVERTDVSEADAATIAGLVVDLVYKKMSWESVARGLKKLGDLVSKYGYNCTNCKVPGFYLGSYCHRCDQHLVRGE